MPRITRVFVKTAFTYFVAALTLGVLLAARPQLDLPPSMAALTPVYFHFFMVGWVTLMIFGIGYWMFPKFSRERPRGSDALAWTSYALLNTGLILRAVAEPMQVVRAAPVWGWLLAASALVQWLGGLAFIVNTWPRVKER